MNSNTTSSSPNAGTTPTSTGSRPIPARGEAMSFSAASKSMSSAVVLYLLNNTRPEELHERMKRAVQSQMMMTRDLDNLLVSLQTVGVVTSAAVAAAKDETVRHCVRCHAAYLERFNGLGACTVMHDAPRIVVRKNQAGIEEQGLSFQCCKRVTPQGLLPRDVHYTGRHTTIVANVQYTGTNIIQCEQRKCHGHQGPGGIAQPVATPTPARVEVTKARV